MKIPGPKAIAFMVLRGFGQFLSVTGMVGITLVIGPLDLVIGKLNFDLLADSKGITFLACLGFCVAGGVLDFFANEALKAIDEKRLIKELKG
jgi:hypothetical protein